MTLRKRTPRPTGRIRAVLAIGGILGLGTVSTLAAWTDDATATATFSSGSIDLQLGGDQGKPDAYQFTSLSVTGMKPGDSTAATLPVQNKGSLPFTYKLTATATPVNTLSGALTVTVTTGSVTGSGNSEKCGGTNLMGPASISGSPSMSRTSAVAAGEADTLCIEVDLPTGTGNDAQGQSTSVNLAFEAQSK